MNEFTTPSFKDQVIFCGFDVHKKKWQVCVRHCDREIACFSATANAEAVAKKLQSNYPDAEIRSVYEAGFSGFEAHRTLCEHGITNIVINPADVPTSGKERDYKNDRIDCRKLAKTLEAGLLEAIYVPSREQLQLRNIIRRETQVVGALTRTINQLKSSWYFNGERVPPTVSGNVLDVYEEMSLSRKDFSTLSLIWQIRYFIVLRKQIVEWEKEKVCMLHLSETLRHLQSVPGIGFRSAIVLLSELWDMHRFPDKNHLASYVGLAPHLVGSGEHEETASGGNRKQRQLHYILIQAAWRAARYDPGMISLFGKLHKRRISSKRIACIIAKKLLFIIRTVWLENRDYQGGIPETKTVSSQTGSVSVEDAMASPPPPSPTRLVSHSRRRRTGSPSVAIH